MPAKHDPINQIKREKIVHVRTDPKSNMQIVQSEAYFTIDQ